MLRPSRRPRRRPARHRPERRRGRRPDGRCADLPNRPRGQARATVAAMTWSARKRAWEARRVADAVERAPERKPRFSTISDTTIHRLWGPGSGQPGADGDPAGGAGPTLVDHHGDRLRREDGGRWDDFDPLRDIGLPGEPPFTRGIH